MAKKEKSGRRWAVHFIRKRMELLGSVYAPDQEAAPATAIAEFKLTDEQAMRLVIDER